MEDQPKFVTSPIAIKLLAKGNDPELVLEAILWALPDDKKAAAKLAYEEALDAYRNANSTLPVVPVRIDQDLGRFSQSEVIVEANPQELQLLKCPTCGGKHFRHAGYVIPMIPYEEKNEAKVSTDAIPVYVCVKDRTSFICYDRKIQIVSDFVDLEAWENFEKEAHKATGPGGLC